MTALPRSLAVVVGALAVPRWQQVLIDDLTATGHPVSAHIFDAKPPPGRSSRLLRLLEWWDRRRLGSPDDLLELVPVTPAPSPLELHSEHDLLVWLTDASIPPPLAAEVPLGVWYLLQGNARTQADRPLVPELRSGEGTVETSLWSFDGHRHAVLLSSTGAADTVSIHRARLRAYAKAARLPRRRLRELAQGGLSPPMPGGTVDATKLHAAPPSTTPADWRLAADVGCRIAARVSRRRLAAKVFDERWVVAWRPRSLEVAGPSGGIRWFRVLPCPPGHYYADPFPVERGDEACLLVEDFPEARGKGVIGAAKLGSEGAGPVRTVLELDSHLSYPSVFEEDGELFMIPESRKAKRIELWRASSFPERWEPVRVLLTLAAADATLLRHDGRLWLFAAVAVDDGAPIEELHLFHASSLESPWEPHPQNPIVSDVRRARPAGPIFEEDGALIRPAQDCSRAYGWRTVLNRIETLTMSEYREVAVTRIEPVQRKVTRTHTYSVRGDLEAVDALVRVPRIGPLRRRLPGTVAVQLTPWAAP